MYEYKAQLVLNCIYLLYALMSVLFASFVLFKEDGTNTIRTVAQAAAVMLIWPILAVIHVISELFKLVDGEVDDVRDGE